MSLAQPPQLLVRAFNSVCGSLWPQQSPVRFHPDVLEERARRATGIDDFGGSDYREGLEVLCGSLERDADLTAFGRITLQVQIHNALVTRLQRLEARRQKPEVFDAPLPRPLIVVGLPRSGTTFLHRMLSLAPGGRALSTWEVRRPLASSGVDLRRPMAALHVTAFKMAMPGIDAKHRIDLDDPEECMFLLDSSLRSPTFWAFAPVYRYHNWLLDQDLHPSYRDYRELLQLLTAADPSRNLVLKAPAHTVYLEELLEAVPEAMLVQTHRDPVRITSSINSLFSSFHGALCHEIDHERMARVNLDWLTRMANNSITTRERVGGDRVLDISYDGLVRDPIGVVRRIHSHYDLAFVPEHEARLEAYLQNRPRRRFGKHVYSAEEFGMTDTDIAEAFRSYTERFVESSSN